MRIPLAIAACFGFALATSISGQASAQDQDTYQSSARMLVLNRDAAAPSNGVRILRGSSAPARAKAAPARDELLGEGRWQVVAGEEFWAFDRETGKIASCRNRGTANVGEREIECTFGKFGRYRRTFGDNFTH